MVATVTKTPNCDEAGVVGKSTHSPPPILKSEPLPTCKKSLQAVDFQFVKNFNTFYNFPSVSAAAAANEEDTFRSCCWQHHCCMVPPLLAKKGIDMTRRSDSTSMLRSESNYLGHSSKRCSQSWCPNLRRRQVADRFQRQRGCGSFSLGRRIKG